MKPRQIKAHMKAAEVYAELSYCNLRKVGCVIVKNDRIISIGYNGTPPGADNTCEDDMGETRPDVIHAEHNAIIKLEGTTETGKDAVLFTTTAPCVSCAEKIIGFGINTVFYKHPFKHDHGIQYLIDRNVTVEQISTQQ